MKKSINSTIRAMAVMALALSLLLGTSASAMTIPSPINSILARRSAARITVSASGSVRLTPDKAAVSFGVTTREETPDQAQSKNSEAVKNVTEVLTGRGIDEKSIRTTNYSLYPQYDYSENGEERITGYIVCTTISIQDQDIGDIGKLLSDCVAAGITNVDSVSFLCSGYDEAYRQALAEAVKAARVKAEALANAAGKTLGDVLTVTEGWQDTSARYSRSANIALEMPSADEASGVPSFLPGESEISANVTVTYRMT